MADEITFSHHPLFERTAIQSGLLSEADLEALREELVEKPDAGTALGASLYKIRVAAVQGKGKSGGARVIYLWKSHRNHIGFLAAFAKSKRENITKKELEMLKTIAKNYEID